MPLGNTEHAELTRGRNHYRSMEWLGKFTVILELMVMLHLVLATTFGPSEFVPVAGYSASGHSAHNLVLLNLVLTIWSFRIWAI